jgi:GNAT superfamily N-acetyltransferase
MSLGDDTARCRALEERGFNAWPALQTLCCDGWVFRFANGYTKRANSVNALAPRAPFASVLRAAEPLYAAAGLPLIFRLSPLAGEEPDAVLDTQGYGRLDASLVMTGRIGSNVAVDAGARLCAAPDAGWSAGFAAANAVPDAHRSTHDAMLATLRLPAAFGTLRESGQEVAYGLAVAERHRVGLFDVVTVAGARRRGFAHRLVGSLLAWGRQQGASGAWLQVVATNAPALALYQRCGFSEAYRYHYRCRDDPRGPRGAT